MPQQAAERGIRELAITDHLDFEPGAPAFGYSTFADRERIVRDAAERWGPQGVTIRFGIELTYDRSWEGDIRDHLARHAYDFTIGSVHDRVRSPYHPANVAGWVAGRSLRGDRRALRSTRSAAAARSGLFDTIGHIDVVKRYLHPHVLPERFAEQPELYEPILRALVESGTALEVNTSGLRHGPAETYPARGDRRPVPRARRRAGHDRLGRPPRATHFAWALGDGYDVARSAGFEHLAFRDEVRPLPPRLGYGPWTSPSSAPGPSYTDRPGATGAAYLADPRRPRPPARPGPGLVHPARRAAGPGAPRRRAHQPPAPRSLHRPRPAPASTCAGSRRADAGCASSARPASPIGSTRSTPSPGSRRWRSTWRPWPRARSRSADPTASRWRPATSPTTDPSFGFRVDPRGRGGAGPRLLRGLRARRRPRAARPSGRRAPERGELRDRTRAGRRPAPRRAGRGRPRRADRRRAGAADASADGLRPGRDGRVGPGPLRRARSTSSTRACGSRSAAEIERTGPEGPVRCSFTR